MKKYLSILILFGLLLVPAMSKAQVSSTVEKRVVPRAVPVLKKSYETAVKQSPAVSSAPRSVLKLGMNGEDVRYLQAWLYNQGYDIDIDGVFGRGTKKALIAFQKSTNGALSTDGSFGPLTALYIQGLPTGVAVKSLDEGTIKYLKGKQIATISGKEVTTKTITASSKVKTAPKTTSKSVIAKLPKDVKSVLSKALPKTPTLTPVQVASSSSTVPKTVTKKPKAAIAALISKSKVSLVTTGNTSNNLVASANLNTNFSKGEAGKATGEYICAEFSGDNMCAAVSAAIAAAIKAGQLDAKDVLAEILSNDGICPFCSGNENGGLDFTSGGAGGSCGGGGGPGTGEFITPDPTPVGTDPDACIPFEDLAGKAYSLAVTSDNVFTAYWGLKGTDGTETLQVIGKDMNWDEPTSTGTSTQPGWKSAEAFSGTAPTNVNNLYFAVSDDGWVTHGLLASMSVGGEKYETGSPMFEVTKTTTPGPVHPNDFSTTDVLNHIKNGTWAQTFLVGDGEHGMSPWGIIPGIPLSAKWIFESEWDPEGLMANYEIYKLKVCSGDTTPTATVDDLCMNFRTDENGNPTNGKSYYKVTFSESVIVTGSPRLLIKKNATSPTATAVFDGYADADHKVIKFVADIGSGLNNNIDSPYYEGVGTIEQVNGSTIKTVVGGKNAPTAVGTFLFTDTCGAPNTPEPDVCVSWADVAVYGDDVIEYKVTYPTNVTVDNKGSNSNIELIIDHTNPNIPNTTAILVGSSGKTLHFVRNSTNLQAGFVLPEYTGQATLNFKNSATVKLGGVTVGTNLGAFNSECIQILSGSADYRPTLLEGEPGGNNRVDYRITFNRAVTMTGAPTLKVKNANGTEKVEATYRSGNNTATLVFHASYPATGTGVPSFPTDFEGTGVFYLNGGTIKDMNDHPMNLTVPASVIFDYTN